MEIEIDRDGEIPVEMARRLLWEHQGIEITGRHCRGMYSAQRPASRQKRSRAA